MAQAPTETPDWTGLQIAITGRLASMTREQARERIEAAGAIYSDPVTPETHLLVVGRGGPPLDEEGRLTAKLRLARELAEAGGEIHIEGEEVLVAMLTGDHELDLDRLYTTDQLGRILEIPRSTVRSWIRHGLIQPVRVSGNLHFFDFAELATARTLAQLTRDGVTPARIRRSLEELAAWSGTESRALSQLEVLEGSGPLLLRTEEGQWVETSGQLRLDFDGTAAPARAVPRLHLVPDTADDWFESGVQAEDEGRIDDAIDAYREALARSGPTVDVCLNLGNALYSTGQRREAADCYSQAAELAPDCVEAWNNLGIVLGEMNRLDEAIRAYRRALAMAPDYSDAHFNLAETLAVRGELGEARRHWSTYLELDPTSLWAERVRERLRRSPS